MRRIFFIFLAFFSSFASAESDPEHYVERLIEHSDRSPTLLIGYGGNAIGESTASFVFGGTPAFPHTLGSQSELSIIGGGYDNSIGNTAPASTVAGGAHHSVLENASHASILGGSYQTVGGPYATAIAGTKNKATSLYSIVVGGNENISDGSGSFVGGGGYNKADGDRSVVVGGRSNQASGTESVVGGGYGNTVTGDHAAVIGGIANTSSGLAALAYGSGAKASGNYSVGVGEHLEAAESGAWATGIRSKAYLRGQQAHAAGYFSEKGDAQMSNLVARATTTNSHPVVLDLNGGGQSPLALPDNTAWGFTARITAKRIDRPGEYARYRIEGLVVRESGAASTTLKFANKIVDYEDRARWDVEVSADVVNGALRITCKGEAGKVVRWVGRIELEEVAG